MMENSIRNSVSVIRLHLFKPELYTADTRFWFLVVVLLLLLLMGLQFRDILPIRRAFGAYVKDNAYGYRDFLFPRQNLCRS